MQEGHEQKANLDEALHYDPEAALDISGTIMPKRSQESQWLSPLQVWLGRFKNTEFSWEA